MNPEDLLNNFNILLDEDLEKEFPHDESIMIKGLLRDIFFEEDYEDWFEEEDEDCEDSFEEEEEDCEDWGVHGGDQDRPASY